MLEGVPKICKLFIIYLRGKLLISVGGWIEECVEAVKILINFRKGRQNGSSMLWIDVG